MTDPTATASAARALPAGLAAFDLTGRLALVTGGSKGIGLAFAAALGRAGARVVLNARDPARLETARAALAAQGIDATACAFDVTDAAAVEEGVARIERETGPIEILVANAGLTHRAPFAEFPLDRWNDILRTNVDGVFLVGQAVAKRMIPRGRGRIVNTCSVMSELGRPTIAPYTASKGAVKMLTKGMAIDLGPHGIQVNGIGPGYFRTELTEALVADAAFTAWLCKRTPAGRWGEVDELAGAVVFLASDAARFVTGHVLYVDGGITASV
jgi:gluconate 5-dehydrogenase